MHHRQFSNTKNLGLLERWIVPRIQRLKAMLWCLFHPTHRVYTEMVERRGRNYLTYVGVVSGSIQTDDLAFRRHYYGHTILEAIANE